VDVGAVHVIVAVELPVVTVTAFGAVGTPAGVVETDVLENALLPLRFTARTLNV
jgi:hypothetical protein